MKFHFYKYQGAGNDFIMIDDRVQTFPAKPSVIKDLCNRYFGIGADGLILLQNDDISDFKMVYFNSDGRESTMCGNGGRCIVRFAEDLGVISSETKFNAIDGLHEASIFPTEVQLKMCDVLTIEIFPTHLFLNTGSPHHVEFVSDLEEIDVKQRGAEICYGSPYFDEGTNVNFVEVLNDSHLKIRTYERGVEDETLACGTGITAAAIAFFERGMTTQNEIQIAAKGGDLKVQFEKNVSGGYENIWLTGPAEFVFKGEISI
ncbi:MAG: diaminopimelate epimerase [Moheibacter sp.]